MAFNFSILANFFEQVDSNIDSYLFIDGFKYEVSRFSISFSQAVDHKGQPQHEVKGGQFIVILTQIPNPTIYDWAKRSNKAKSGQILFQTATRGTILDLKFEEAHCFNLTQNINYQRGTEVKMVITANKITISDFVHNNNWVK